MTPDEIRERIPPYEISFTTSRSGGPGGQNINKVNTKVEIRFDIKNSFHLTQQEKERILMRLKNRISSEGVLILTSQSERTQLMNRKKAEEKLFVLLASALTEKKKRRSTKPTSASVKERLEKKRIRSKIKKMRKGKDPEQE